MSDVEKIVLSMIVISWVVILFLTYIFGKRFVTNKVKKSSKVLSELENINGKIKYTYIKPNYYYSYDCASRAMFNHFDLDDYFVEIICDNKDFFKMLIKSIEKNKKEVAKYKRSLDKIDFSQTADIAKSVKIPLHIYRYFENKCYHEMILSEPVIDISITCRKEYTTPAGRTHTWSDVTYNYKQLLQFYEKANKIQEQREIRSGQIEYERSLMTASMRYEILRRDNFRCQLCGSTAQDGVKLHIDHIVPVSKGGHTTPENLRVLCDRCNFGKRDKIE